MRRLRVPSFFAEVTQQIHSFRASGVIEAQRLFAAASDSMAFPKSDGSLCMRSLDNHADLLDQIVRPRGHQS